MDNKIPLVDIYRALKSAVVYNMIEDNRDMSKYSYFVVFYRATTLHLVIHHIIGYKVYPSDKNILHNYEELKTDDDFKLSPDVLKTLEHKVIDLKGV